jgi:hypothetical protein
MTYSLSTAAERIGVSVSTLRRRYAELECGNQWPVTKLEYENLPMAPKVRKGEVSLILNGKNARNCSSVDDVTLAVLNAAFKQHEFH